MSKTALLSNGELISTNQLKVRVLGYKYNNDGNYSRNQDGSIKALTEWTPHSKKKIQEWYTQGIFCVECGAKIRSESLIIKPRYSHLVNEKTLEPEFQEKDKKGHVCRCDSFFTFSHLPVNNRRCIQASDSFHESSKTVRGVDKQSQSLSFLPKTIDLFWSSFLTFWNEIRETALNVKDLSFIVLEQFENLVSNEKQRMINYSFSVDTVREPMIAHYLSKVNKMTEFFKQLHPSLDPAIAKQEDLNIAFTNKVSSYFLEAYQFSNLLKKQFGDIKINPLHEVFQPFGLVNVSLSRKMPWMYSTPTRRSYLNRQALILDLFLKNESEIFFEGYQVYNIDPNKYEILQDEYKQLQVFIKDLVVKAVHSTNEPLKTIAIPKDELENSFHDCYAHLKCLASMVSLRKDGDTNYVVDNVNDCSYKRLVELILFLNYFNLDLEEKKEIIEAFAARKGFNFTLEKNSLIRGGKVFPCKNFIENRTVRHLNTCNRVGSFDFYKKDPARFL